MLDDSSNTDPATRTRCQCQKKSGLQIIASEDLLLILEFAVNLEISNIFNLFIDLKNLLSFLHFLSSSAGRSVRRNNVGYHSVKG
jgi:hypothetical protein